MPVPKEILQVPRPENTTVYAYGKHKDLYGVRERTGTKLYKDGKHRPTYGKVVGHIVNNMFIPKKESEMHPELNPRDERDTKEWGACVLCDREGKSLLLDMLRVFDEKEAITLYCLAILRVLIPGVKDYQIQDKFLGSWLSSMYRKAALSKNSISSLLERVGHQSSKIVAFLQYQTEALNEDDVLAVDGTLKKNNSKVNTYSRYSRNYYKKGELGNISILYAMDLKTGLPKAFKAYPGNISDSNAYGDFIKTNRIRNGLLIGDRAFTESAAREQFKENPGLHFLHPLKRNAKIIQLLEMRDFEGTLPGYEGVFYTKASYYDEKLKKTIYLYSFMDLNIHSREMKTWGEKSRGLDRKTYKKEFKEEFNKSGTIVLQSDLDLTPVQAYLLYKGRWQIELLMRLYKQAIKGDTTGKHKNASVLGSEFVNFLSLSIEARVRNYLIKTGVLDDSNYKTIMDELLGVQIEKLPNKKDWQLKTMSKKTEALLRTLELIPSEPPKKRGRPPKVKGSSAAKAARREAHAEAQQTVKRGRGRPPGAKNKKTLERERLQKLEQQNNPAAIPVKRPRGRPPGAKNKKTLERERLQALQQQENPVLTTAEAKVESVTKRKRGRPAGAKNKKTIERERQAALKKAAQKQQASSD